MSVLPPVEVVVASGDAQFGTTGQLLATPLRVVVRTVSSRSPKEGVSVQWEIEQGNADLDGVTTTVTDSTGSTEIRVRLGSTPGEITVRATVVVQQGATTTFRLFTVDRPELDQLTPTAAPAGGTITLTGSNFSPVPEQNVVLFSGIRGRVLSASQTVLTVEVPPCLPARDVAVSVQLGVVGSGSRPLTVTGGGVLTTLQVGEVVDVSDDDGFPCFGLPGGVGVRYLAIVYSASAVGAATHPYQLTGLSSTVPLATSPPARTGRPAEGVPRVEPDPQAAWDEHLHSLEAELIRDLGGRVRRKVGPALGAPPAGVPAVDERRTFSVANLAGTFDQVTAVARYVGAEAAIFVDEDAPAGGFTPADLQLFAERFDQVIHPEVAGVFGATSDLDGNERVVILFTPAVNKLTSRGTTGFVGGFFFGRDLLPGQSGSNGGEIFYALVPDPEARFSDRRTKNEVLAVVPGILAHEFEHMVHFNQRILTLGARDQETLWLSEGLAQMAEEVVARAYEALGDSLGTTLFRAGTRSRVRRYLRGPDTVSLIVAAGQGSLAERGAGFLFLLYLSDQEGMGVLGRLTSTTRTGVDNVEAEVGGRWPAWPDVLADWWSAVYLDGAGPETGPLVYPTVDLRGLLGPLYPLDPAGVGPGDFTESGSLWSSSAAYYIVVPVSGGSTALRLGGGLGGASAAQSLMRMRIIRLS